MQRTLIALLLLGAPLSPLPAQELEDAPDRDLGQVDRAAEQEAKDLLQQVTLESQPGEPELDGRLDDPFWERALALKIDIELYPERLAKPVVETDVLVSGNATHLYVAFDAHEPDVNSIRSANRQHDGVKDDDYVSIVLDPTGNLRRKFEFRVNPHGSRTDVLQDAVSNRYIYDWDTRWKSAARISESGYQVEIEIPLDSIKSPPGSGTRETPWLAFFKRTYPRAVDRTFGGIYLFDRGEVEAGQPKRKKVELIPYAIFNPEEGRDSGEPFKKLSDSENYGAGFDLKLVFDSATSLSATVNPNYTDVEADIARDSINNPFTPFQPEKRAFFQEGRDLYSSLMPAVYTRNIVQPDIGLSFSRTGRDISSGAFWIDDDNTELIMPDNLGSDQVELETESESMAVRATAGRKGTAYGAMLTGRTGADYSNYVGGFDGLWNLGLDDKLRYQLMYSKTKYPTSFAQDLCSGEDCPIPEDEPCLLGECDVSPYVLRADPQRDLNGHGIRLSYKHDSPDSLYWVNYFDYAEDFRADLGFDKRTDYRQLNIAYGRNWFVNALKRDRGKSRLRAYLVGNAIESSDGEQIEQGVDIWGEFRGSFQTVARAGYRVKERAVNRINQNSLALGDNAPLFDESYWQWYYEVAPVTPLTLNLDGRYGDVADAANLVLGEMLELKPRFRYLLSDRLSFDLSHIYRDYELDGSRLYRENFFTFKVLYRPWNRHIFRLLYLDDRTDRDISRFLGEELPREDESTLEFTYLYRRDRGLSILAGANVQWESDSETSEFTSEREVYVKLVYDLRRDLPEGW